jgi:hypothetical protein
MAERSHAISQVRLYEAARNYTLKYDGFARNNTVAELYRRGQLSMSPAEGGTFPEIGGTAVPGAMLVQAGGLNALLARPRLDTTQAVGLGHFSPLAGSWLAMKSSGLGSEVKLYQYDGTSALTGIQSDFELPTNPVFAISLYRADLPWDFEWISPPYTEIHFGIADNDEWALSIPYGQPMLLSRYLDGEWRKVSNSDEGLNIPVFEGMARGQRILLWFAVIRDHVVISTDGFVDQVWAHPLESGEVVRKGHVSLWHNAGQWMYSFFPIAMDSCTVTGPAISAGYDTLDCTGAPILNYRHLPVTNDAGDVLQQVQMEDITDTETPAGARQWQATLNPHTHVDFDVGSDPDTGESVDLQTCVSPELYSVQIGQYGEMLVGDDPASVDLADSVIAVSGDVGDDMRAARYSVTLDNQDGGLAAIDEYRPVDVALGWKLDDGTDTLQQVVSGYLAGPESDIAPAGTCTVHLETLDGMIRLRDEKVAGRAPVFDNWSVREAFEWVLQRCGIPPERRNLEDTGKILGRGEPEDPAWQPETGRSWTEVLAQMARYDHGAAFWFDEDGIFHKGCPYCRQARTEGDVVQHDGTATGACDCSVDWSMYTRPEVAPDPSAEGEILRLQRLRESLAGSDYRNFVMVGGRDASGRPVRSMVYDADSVYDPSAPDYVGWRKMEVYQLRGTTSQAEANQLAAELLEEYGPDPEYVLIVTPLAPGMRIGDVVEIHGGEAAGADGGLYRIRHLRHRVRQAPRKLAYTVIRAKALA